MTTNKNYYPFKRTLNAKKDFSAWIDYLCKHGEKPAQIIKSYEKGLITFRELITALYDTEKEYVENDIITFDEFIND